MTTGVLLDGCDVHLKRRTSSCLSAQYTWFQLALLFSVFKTYSVKMVRKEPGIPKSEKSIKTKRYCTPQSHSLHLSVDVDRPKTIVSKRKRTPKDPDKARLCTLQRAEEVQSSLGPEFPSFVKYMLPSHVTGGFWLGLPSQFCQLHLPKQDETITLVNEDGEEYPTKFLVDKTGLSGGWRGFSIVHKLVEGDVLVFHLIEATKFKVYIIRAYGLDEVDGALSLLDLDFHIKHTGPGWYAVKRTKNAAEKPAEKREKSPPLSTCLWKNQSTLNLGMPARQAGNDIEEVASEALLCIKSSGSNGKFEDVKNLESFTIKVDGFSIDSEISTYFRTKYYELCCSQKAFLHENLLEGINFKLAAGIISETVNIADAIKASKLSTSQVDFAIWDKSLMAFERMGMNVGFLRSKLQSLMSLDYESDQAKDSKRVREATIEQAHAEEEIRTTEAKLLELKRASKRLEVEIETLKVKAQIWGKKFEAQVGEPW